jgi:hypothetical protein
MDYGRIIRRALEITWRHKVLWVFGIAAALFSGGNNGGGGDNGFPYQLFQYRFGESDLYRWRQGMPFAPDISAAIPIILAIIGVLFVVFLVFAIVSIIVRYTSLGALIGGVDEVERTERTSFRSGLRTGWRRLLRLFAIDLIIGIAVFALVLALIVLAVAGVLFAVLPAIAIAESNGGPATLLAVLWGVGVGLAVILVIVAVAVVISAVTTLVRELSFRANVLERQGIFASIGTAFRAMRANLKEVLLVWLILVAINLALSIVAIPLVVVGAVGMIGPAVAAYAVTESIALAALIAVPLVFLFVLVSAFLGGLILTFRSAVWTLAYREWRTDHLAPEAT